MNGLVCLRRFNEMSVFGGRTYRENENGVTMFVRAPSDANHCSREQFYLATHGRLHSRHRAAPIRLAAHALRVLGLLRIPSALGHASR